MDWFKEYETLDEIPEGAREAFEEKDGKFRLIKALDPSGLKTTLEKQKKQIKDLQAVEKKFKDMGLEDEQIESLADDLEELAALRAQKESGELKGDELNAKVEELVAKRVETEKRKFERDKAKLEKDLSERDEFLKGTRGKLHELTLDQQLAALAAKKGVKSEQALKKIKRFGRDEFAVNDDGEIIDKTDAGRTIESWLDDEISADWTLTADPKPGGTNAQPGNGKPGGKPTYKRADYDKLPEPQRREIALRANKGEATIVD